MKESRELHVFVQTELARLLDERRFDEWMELFDAKGYYWAPARPEQADPWSEISLLFDDRDVMKNRIGRLRHPRVGALRPGQRWP